MTDFLPRTLRQEVMLQKAKASGFGVTFGLSLCGSLSYTWTSIFTVRGTCALAVCLPIASQGMAALGVATVSSFLNRTKIDRPSWTSSLISCQTLRGFNRARNISSYRSAFQDLTVCSMMQAPNAYKVDGCRLLQQFRGWSL